MRQTLCDGYLVIFALAQAVILLMLTHFLRVFPGRYALANALRRGPGIWQDYRDIHKLFPNAGKLRLYLRVTMFPPDAVGINQQHAGAGDGPTTFYYRFPFCGRRRSDHPYLSSCPVSFFLCSFRAGYRKPVCGSQGCQSRVERSAFWSNPCSFSHCWYWR